jgi:hypothetical protein
MRGRYRVGEGGMAALLGLAAFMLLCLAFHLGAAFAGSRGPLRDDLELEIFPAGAEARPLAFGFSRLAADAAWLQAIQYYGRHRMTDRRYPYAEILFTTLTGLDPGFEAGYVFGALVLADVKPVAARSLLAAGMRANPGSWRLCFEYGFLAFLQRTDYAEAAEYLSRAAHMPGAPASIGRLAAYAAGRAGEREFACRLWREMLDSTQNAEVRRIARRYLRELGAPEADGPLR